MTIYYGARRALLNTTSIVSASAQLYPFTTVTFNNGGQTGRTGPSLAQTQSGMTGTPTPSNWNTNTSYFTVTSGAQFWTVPQTGNYTIKIRGGNGVPSTGASAGAEGGQGIILQFNFTLIQGEIIKIIVGQSGTATSLHGGGGGATAVLRSPYNTVGSIIGIAGGGGGRRTASTGVGIPGASYTTYGGYGTRNGTNSAAFLSGVVANGPTTNAGWSPTAATLEGGGPAAGNGYGDGGAGFSANGFDDSAVSTVAQSLIGTAVGGFSAAASDGGFGGGGNGAGGNGGGGGGGYTGGSGGHTAGGGGSYINASATNYTESFDGNVTRIGSVTTLFHGYCQITAL
jgi:hypothetical protein